MTQNEKICISQAIDFNLFLKNNNFFIRDVPGDGHCMIYSFLTSYYGNINNYKNTLALLKKQLVNNDLEWLPFTTFGDKKQLYFEAVNYFLNKKQWQNSICDVILNYLSKLHKCRIQVCVVENSFLRMITLVTFDREYQKIIHLKFESQHYEAILSNKLFFVVKFN
jgi:hypothetical protein